MANFYHYLEWRGDLSFDASPFNEVDALILTWLAYADLKEIVPNAPDAQGILIKEAANVFFATHEKREKVNLLDSLNPPLTATVLLDRLSVCDRFKDLKLTFFVDKIDYENPMQFAAMTVILPGGALFIAYRGTDRTFVGWKEDFYISCMDEIPSQRDALLYLEKAAATFARKPILVGGHSKGGNLAAYACIHASKAVRNRIRACYNNDGPGFSRKVVESEAYRQMREKIFKFVPQGSIVGILFDNERGYQVIKSAQVGFLQHNGPCWEVLGPRFVRADNLVKSAEAFDESLSAWLDQLDHEQRRRFIDAFFAIFEKSELKTFDDIGANRLKSLLKIAHALSQTEPETRGMLVKSLFGLFRARSALTGNPKELQE